LLLERQSSATASIQGMAITLPPPVPGASTGARIKAGNRLIPAEVMMLDSLVATDTTLTIESSTSGHPPIELTFERLSLGDFAVGKAFAYDAVLVGLNGHARMHSKGHIGPWNSERASQIPLDGNYHLTALDLATVNGLRGTLAAHGRVVGTLREIAVDGTSDIPDLAFDTSAHPIALHIDYHAILNGLRGTLDVEPATLHLLGTTFTATGSVARDPDHPTATSGFDTDLDLVMKSGRAEDVLALVSSPRPAIMTAIMSSTTHLAIKPGPQRLIQRIVATGSAQLDNVLFSNPTIQQQFDSLSLRAEGHPKEAKQLGPNVPKAPSDVTGNFRMSNGNIDLSQVVSRRPAMLILLDGRYELTGTEMDMHGVLRTAVPASHMTSGWKSLLAKPLDPFLKKHGAGMELPIRVNGDRSNPHFGLDLANRDRDAHQTERIPTTLKP
jgi:hypothetical protein